MTWDPDSKNCGSKLSSLSFKIDGRDVDVKNLSEPIIIKIENNNLDTQNISMRMPGEMKVSRIKLPKTTDPLMVRFNFADDGFPTLRLIVYMQYGIVPNRTHYDLKINISREGGIDMEANNASVHEKGNNETDEIMTKRRSFCKTLDDRSFMCYDFDNFTYGWKKNKLVWLSAMYEGPMPPKRLVSNPYNYDVFEYAGTMNFSRQMLIPSCRYWNERTDKFDDDGVEVSAPLSFRKYISHRISNFHGIYTR